MKQFFNKIKLFLVQAELYKQRFIQLGLDEAQIKVCGNIKADEAFGSSAELPLETEIRHHLKLPSADAEDCKPLVVLASSHSEDEAVVFPVLRDLSDSFQFIIVPRHLERVPAIEKMLTGFGESFSTWSKCGKDETVTDTLIFDSMGYLFHVLKIATVVYMGGTMNPDIGGHNLYEPVSLGKLVVGGPHFNNFPDIGAEMVKREIYKVVTDSDQLRNILGRCSVAGTEYYNPDYIALQTAEVIEQRRGSLECTLTEIHRLTD